MAQHLVASLGDEAYAVAPTLARPNSGTMQQRCTASAHGQCRKLDGPKEEHGTGDDRDDGSLCGPCTALWFSRVLTFDMRGGRKQAKLACGRPLDGRVRLHSRQHGEKWPLATNGRALGDLQAASHSSPHLAE